MEFVAPEIKVVQDLEVVQEVSPDNDSKVETATAETTPAPSEQDTVVSQATDSIQKKKKKKRGKKKKTSKGEQYKTYAMRQVEYFFSEDELSRNVFIRKKFDVNGYIPAALIFNFRSVSCYGIPYKDLLHCIKERSKSVEVNLTNETLRVKGGDYKKWLYPNDTTGTYGCPRWFKVHQDEGTTESTITKTTSRTIQKSSTEELSSAGVPALAESSCSSSATGFDVSSSSTATSEYSDILQP